MAGVPGNRLFNAGAAGILALITLTTAFAESAADTNQPQAQTVSVDADFGRQFLEATNTASEYSKQNRSIGIVIAYAASPGMSSADKIGDDLVQQFRSRGVEADFFVVPSPKPGATAAYVIEDVVIGPFGDKAMATANIDRAVSLRRGADNVLDMKGSP